MNMEQTPGERLKQARKARGITQAALARAAGLTQSAVGNIEAGTRGFGASVVDLAEALCVKVRWLSTGEGPMEPDDATRDTINFINERKNASLNSQFEASKRTLALMRSADAAINFIEDVYPVEFSIPLLSWVRAGEFCEAPGSFTRDDAQELLPRPLFKVGVNTFALQVVGDSMDAPGGYREGEIVYIDPDVEPTPGRDVLAKADDRMTLKRYKVDEQGPYLLQLNGNKIIRPTEWHVCGVVVYAGRRC